MQEWTDAAKRELDRYLRQAGADSAATGADPAEVMEDLRRHVERELSAAGVALVTLDEVRRALSRLGGPERPGDVEAETHASECSAAAAPRCRAPEVSAAILGRLGVAMAIVFGVILPCFALAIEVLSGICASVFFDPIPTVWHILLVALVPAANAWVCVELLRGRCSLPRFTGWLTALAVGAALYYAVLFLPFTPFACIGVLYLGLGLIPLAPLISLIVALLLRGRLKRLFRALALPWMPPLWRGVVLVLVALFLLEAPKTTTLTGVRLAASDNPATRARGLRLLRCCGSDAELLRSCYGVQKPVVDMITFVYNRVSKPVSATEAQQIYYRVTGTPYNAVAPPDIRGLRRGALIDASDWDFSQGGDEVATRLRGLALRQSRLDAVVDATGCTAYTEWTLVFANTSDQQREARARVALPPGGVVSRLTLWIDGEPREAAFGPRSRVKEAYQQVVRKRRDPVLVTTAGPDQVLLQCFPVPPNGGEMKLRVGVTSPLYLESRSAGILRLPLFLEQNFATAADCAHSVWIEGDGDLSPLSPINDVVAEQPRAGTHALRGKLTEAQIESGFAVRVQRSPDSAETWSEDLRGQDGSGVLQTVREGQAVAPRQIVAVIDGSRRMAPHAARVAEALAKCPEGVALTVLLASDEVIDIAPLQARSRADFARFAEALQGARFAGGCDNVPALLRAWDLAAAETNAAIMWFHATQPVAMADSEALLQKWQRRPGGPVLYAFQFGTGPDKITEAFNGLAAVKPLPNLGDPTRDCARILEEWGGALEVFTLARRRGPPGEARHLDSRGASHVMRLWADEEIRRLAATRNEDDLQRAVSLALAHQLVTPVSGAVVLETKKQYDRAGLTPVAGDTVPQVVPEPGALMLFAMGAVVLLLFSRRRQKDRGTAMPVACLLHEDSRNTRGSRMLRRVHVRRQRG